ncbi:MAG: stage II sporulation protein R [Bacilli bacterium]
MKKIGLIFLIIIILLIKKNYQETVTLIPSEAIRLRILANSDTEYDQQIKIKVRNVAQTLLYELLKDTKGITEARKIIKDNLDIINNKISETLSTEKYQLGYNIDFGIHTFPKKEFKGITYDSGNYESLLISLGSGDGNNWWCVLFPPLCILEAEETNTKDVEYKFLIKELIDKYL